VGRYWDMESTRNLGVGFRAKLITTSIFMIKSLKDLKIVTFLDFGFFLMGLWDS
jgi:hypothetical protein